MYLRRFPTPGYYPGYLCRLRDPDSLERYLYAQFSSTSNRTKSDDLSCYEEIPVVSPKRLSDPSRPGKIFTGLHGLPREEVG